MERTILTTPTTPPTPDDSDVTPTGRTGRPRIELDTDQIAKLAEIQCTIKEIAYIMGVSTDTISRNYADVVEAGKQSGKMQLRRAQWRKAVEEGNPTMQIWLGKQYLEQADQPINTADTAPLPWTTPPTNTTGDADAGS